MPEDKRLVYVLKSANPKAHYYIGLTADVAITASSARSRYACGLPNRVLALRRA